LKHVDFEYLYTILKSVVLFMCTSLRFEPLSEYESTDLVEWLDRTTFTRSFACAEEQPTLAMSLSSNTDRILFLLLLEKFRCRKLCRKGCMFSSISSGTFHRLPINHVIILDAVAEDTTKDN